MLSEPEKRLVERELEIASDVDLVRWAMSALADDAALALDPDIVELASLPTGDVRKCESALALLRRAVLASNPGFELSSKEAEAHAREAFIVFCRRFVAGDLGPYEFCRVVNPIEQLFDYPPWLGNFYNECDWCEPESTRRDFDHLVEYAARYVAENVE
jgi:hypothetical protein